MNTTTKKKGREKKQDKRNIKALIKDITHQYFPSCYFIQGQKVHLLKFIIIPLARSCMSLTQKENPPSEYKKIRHL